MTQLNPANPQAAEQAASPTAASAFHVLYPHTYVWYVFVSALDVMFTAVLLHFGGREVNVLANWVLVRWDLAGMVMFKFVLVSFVICICEFVGRKRHRLGRDLGHWAVGITCIPVLLAALQLITHAPI
jgi:hypothetical protein